MEKYRLDDYGAAKSVKLILTRLCYQIIDVEKKQAPG
jgi:hypothetical protein